LDQDQEIKTNKSRPKNWIRTFGPIKWTKKLDQKIGSRPRNQDQKIGPKNWSRKLDKKLNQTIEPKNWPRKLDQKIEILDQRNCTGKFGSRK
jgi:hypothetical protein